MLPHQNRHLFYGFLLFFLSLSVSPHIFLWQTYLSSLVCPHSFSVSFSLPTLSSFLTFVSIYLHPPSIPPSLPPSLHLSLVNVGCESPCCAVAAEASMACCVNPFKVYCEMPSACPHLLSPRVPLCFYCARQCQPATGRNATYSRISVSAKRTTVSLSPFFFSSSPRLAPSSHLALIIFSTAIRLSLFNKILRFQWSIFFLFLFREKKSSGRIYFFESTKARGRKRKNLYSMCVVMCVTANDRKCPLKKDH